MANSVIEDAWRELRRATPARIALGRAGASLPTQEVLAFALAHARARDAVYAEFEGDRIARQIEAMGWTALAVRSAAPDRPTYLRRPDLGRGLSAESRQKLAALRRCWRRPLDHRRRWPFRAGGQHQCRAVV